MKFTSMQELQTFHSQMVSGLAKDGATIAAELSPENAHLLHMAVGIAGEAGELLDAVKKAAIYNKPIDLVNVVEELGDLEFYMQGLRQGLDITRAETLKANIDKLGKRYKDFQYSDQQAQDRADKQEESDDSDQYEYISAVVDEEGTLTVDYKLSLNGIESQIMHDEHVLGWSEEEVLDLVMGILAAPKEQRSSVMLVREDID